ncbi:MAG: hypothetical protein JXB88_22755 [Spirochaetales bacterium]|nr:hypothetical protein [Spirochaetales bacterium]
MNNTISLKSNSWIPQKVNKIHSKNNRKKSRIKLLLTCVFKPYGVTDEYGDALCSMELLNNQITREQGIHSPRSNNLSFGLYLLAENIGVPVTVLDFPSWKNFTHEVDSGNYTHIGITFIASNVTKTQRMANYIRRNTPETTIILGGHGTAIPDLEKIVDCDEICHGEGVTWLRNYFKENINRPIIHPVVGAAIKASIYGVPLMNKDGVIIPGVGCQNGCRFCSTSHKFNKKYTAFLSTGSDIYKACNKSEKKAGYTHFGLMDENFCKNEIQARQLLVEMEKEQKAYTFNTFSSAEAVTQMGVDFLVRVGVNLIWIGAESKTNIFEKTKGIDLHSLIADLQKHGISVLTSTILFLEHHNKKTIEDDINWAISLESDLHQFMQFGPVPGTPLFTDYFAKGKLINDFPWQHRHGQGTIWFKHPSFTLPETSVYLKNAFIKKYHAHGPGVLNMAHTAIRGYLTVKKEMEDRKTLGLTWDPKTLRYTRQTGYQSDHFMKLRLESIRKNALKFRPLLHTILKYAPNKQSALKSRTIIELFNKTFGPASIKDRIMDIMVKIISFWENRRFQKNGVIMRQPSLIREMYRCHQNK